MRIRAFIISALAATALLSAAGSASAATLFTTASHATRVTVGATAVGTGTNVDLTSGSSVINHCGHSALNLTLAQNNDTEVIGNVTGGSFNVCNSPVQGTFTTPWSLRISGTGTVSGTNTCWNGRVLGVVFDLLGGSYSGSLTTGVTACQPTATGAPLSLKLASAGFVVGPLTGNGRIDGSYVFTGSPASGYSLTN